MPELIVNGVSYQLDEDGFLEDASCWNEDVARALAPNEDVPVLTEQHWRVINFLRIQGMIRKQFMNCFQLALGRELVKLQDSLNPQVAYKLGGMFNEYKYTRIENSNKTVQRLV
jgi:TusE/DsrC/DsvC family sulfur relay protein